jgi:hypothetical protein
MMGSAVGSAALLRASRSRIMAPDILDSLDATTPLPVRVRAGLQASIEDALTIYPSETPQPLLSWFRPFLRIGAGL